MEWVAPMVAGVMLRAGLGFLLKRRRQPELSPHAATVSQQHLYLFQGGKLSESELESIKAGFRRLLERGEGRQIESGMRAGTRFAVEVRALTEIGTPQAGAILERLLQRRLSPDPTEQSWHRLDLAHGLRMVGRPEGLPPPLQCFPAEEAPLRPYLAAEIACFTGFERYLEAPETAPGQAALRVLHQALLGLRNGVQPQVVAAGRLGEAVELAWEQRHRAIDPAAIRVLIEAVRLIPRADYSQRAFHENRRERERFSK